MSEELYNHRIAHIKNFIDSVYVFGSATWDTGTCTDCAKVLSESERYDACYHMLRHGFLYCCKACQDRFMEGMHV